MFFLNWRGIYVKTLKFQKNSQSQKISKKILIKIIIITYLKLSGV